MVDDSAAVERKHRWRGKLGFSKDDAVVKDARKQQATEDVDAFLKPSTEKAQAQKEAAAAAILANAKPRIDVAKAQRWPSARNVLGSAGGVSMSPGPGGLKTGTRKKGLTISFARTQPEIIGHGGDECEEPSIEVSLRKKSNSVSDVDRLQAQTHQDDSQVGMRSPKFNSAFQQARKNEESLNKQAERTGIVKRSLTSAGELSPPLRQKMEMGSINTHASPPPAAPERLGTMGLGDRRPKPLARAPTGFDIEDVNPRGRADSYSSYDSDNTSPVVTRKPPNLPPTKEEEEDFAPKPLKRTGTSWSQYQPDSDSDEPPQLPNTQLDSDSSPVESGKPLLSAEPADPNSFAARVMHAMRAEEGAALHKGHTNGDLQKRDSGSSSSSFQPGSMQSSSFHVGTPPSAYNVASATLYGNTPPRLAGRDQAPTSPQNLDAQDPQRSRARGPSPGRRPMPPGTAPLDTDPRPGSSSSSSYFTHPSAASRTRGSPTGQSEPYTAGSSFSSLQKTPSAYEQNPETNTVGSSFSSLQKTPSAFEKTPFSALSNRSMQAPLPLSERPAYFSPMQSTERVMQQPPPPPPHAQDLGGAKPAPVRPDPYTQVSSQYKQPPAPVPAPAPAPQPPAHRSEPAPQSAASLNRSDTKAQGEAAFLDFAERVTHMSGIFRLTAELGGQLYDYTPSQWIRVAIWWFLRGRVGMENLIRSRPRGAEPSAERLTQPHVDLAKSLWILIEVIPNHPRLRRYGDGNMDIQARASRDAGDAASADVYEAYDSIKSGMKLLFGSMKRHGAMPPTQALIQGQDQSIWEQYPNFSPEVKSVLSGGGSRSLMANGAGQQTLNPAIVIPLGDTKVDFCYLRMFVKVSLSTDDADTDRVWMPAVLSVLRPRGGMGVKLAICSMTDLINVIVQSDKNVGPTWKDVKWRVKTRGMYVVLRGGYDLNVEFNEPDFRTLWGIVDHTNRIESDLRERENERLAFNLSLRDFSYKDPTNPSAFPGERVKECKVMVYEKCERSTEGTGKRRLHRGYRLLVLSSPNTRTLSCVNHELGRQEPMNFEFQTEADSAPAMRLRFREETQDKKLKVCTAYMVFNDSKERNLLFGTLTSMNIAPDEKVFAQVPLKGFSIESADPAEGFSNAGGNVLKKQQWHEVKVLNQDPEAADLESAPMVLSEHLRFIVRHASGTLTDRMNLSPGELLVRLPIDGAAQLTILRNPQQDLAIAIDNSRSERDVPDALADLLRTLTSASTLRTLSFNSFKDLHTFQSAVTGFEVMFDGIASTFSIARRRMVVPIYKQWTASTIRLQIVVQDNIIQLLAFFEDFSHADAMNFQLKSTDTYEVLEKSGKPCVRLPDCKFALPVEERRGEGKMERAEGKISGWAGMKRRFVCLDMIEYPGEHDDIHIAFDNAETRDRFAEALPGASVKNKLTLRRKI